MAVLACEETGIDEYTLLLDKESIDAIDYNVRSSMRTPTASGKSILLKAYRAQRFLQLGFTEATEGDKTYEEAKNAEPDSNQNSSYS